MPDTPTRASKTSPPPPALTAAEKKAEEVLINGRPYYPAGDPDMPLLWYLRDVLRLTGTKFGCGIGACGACTVLIDGKAQRACVTPVKATMGHAVTTIEGLATDAGLHPLQRAWIEEDDDKDEHAEACAAPWLHTRSWLRAIPIDPGRRHAGRYHTDISDRSRTKTLNVRRIVVVAGGARRGIMSRYPAISGARLELSRANRLHTVLRHDPVVCRRPAAHRRRDHAAPADRKRVHEVALPQTLQR